MTNEWQQQRAPLNPIDSYNAAIQLHNQEFRTLGERTNAFLIVQSIFIAAFVYIGITQNSNLIALGICAVGISFCILHYLAGKSGSQATFRWRQYMRHIENDQRDAPWNWFYDSCHHTHDGEKFRNLLTRLQCERCLLKRSPLPTVWLISPAIFLLVWVGAILYIVGRFYLPLCPTLCLAIPLVLVTLSLIIWRWAVWWQHHENS